MSNPSKEVMRRSVERHLTDLERMREFDRGYQAGRHAMDAERYAVALRLVHLPLDGGSHENLSQIARAVYHADFGWTQGACRALRDELVRLLGGASNHGCMGDEDDGQPKRDAGSYRGVTIHVDEQIKLDVERCKAIAELRKFEPMTGGKPTEEASKLIRCITGKIDSHVACGNDLEETRDRLIHLLGGDQPGGIDVSREMDEESDTDGTSPNDVGTSSITDELREMDNGHSRTCPKSGEETSESAPSASITDELRAWAHGLSDPWKLSVEAPLLAIADRIDEQFDRICWQQEAVLQETIDSMCEEQDRLQKRLRTAELGCEANHRLAEANARWCDELVDLLRDARDEYKLLDQMSAETSVNFHAMRDRVWGLEAERDELRRSLRKIAERAGVPHDRDLSEYSDEKIANAVIGQLGETEQHVKSLEWVCDSRLPRIEAERDELQAKLDEIAGVLDGRA